MNNKHNNPDIKTGLSTALVALEPTDNPEIASLDISIIFPLSIIQLLLMSVLVLLTYSQFRIPRTWTRKFYFHWSATRDQVFHTKKPEPLFEQEKSALDCLIKALTPSHSVWPEWYTSLCTHPHPTCELKQPHKALILPLSRILDDLCQNHVQLRDPNDNMHRFIHGEIRSYKWRFLVKVDFTIYQRVIKWIVLSYFISGIENVRNILCFSRK
jgi:hypothetical protein